MPELHTYDYAIIRLVPRVEREEFVNVGAIVSCPARAYLDARIAPDEARVFRLFPEIDLEIIRAHLASIPVICTGGPKAGAIGALSQRERFLWLVSPRSAIIQTSPVHTGTCADPHSILEHLMRSMVLLP